MDILKKVTDMLYAGTFGNHKYVMRRGRRGVLSRGEAWYLKVSEPNEEHLATFTTVSDGNYCERDDYCSKLWHSLPDIIEEAEKIIRAYESA